MKKFVQLVLLIIIVALGVTVWDGFYVLEEGKQAVITQFGAPVGRPITEAGLKLKTPFIQKINIFEKKILIWDGEPNQIPTNDKTFIYMENTARWRISDALRFMQAVGTEARAMALLDNILDGTVRDLVNKNNLIEIIRSSDTTPDDFYVADFSSRELAGRTWMLPLPGRGWLVHTNSRAEGPPTTF